MSFEDYFEIEQLGLEAGQRTIAGLIDNFESLVVKRTQAQRHEKEEGFVQGVRMAVIEQAIRRIKTTLAEEHYFRVPDSEPILDPRMKKFLEENPQFELCAFDEDRIILRHLSIQTLEEWDISEPEFQEKLSALKKDLAEATA